MEIREFTETEAEFVLLEEGERAAFLTSYPSAELEESFEEARISWLLSTGYGIYIGFLDQAMFSYVVVGVDKRDTEEVGHIISIYVKPRYRGKDFVGELLDYAGKVFRDRGIGKIRLDVSEVNISALRAYESYGFRTVGRVMEFKIDT